MSTATTPALALRTFDSAYPGSMFQREDGDYVRRADPDSLAAAMLEHIATREQRIRDLEDALKSPVMVAAPELLEALRPFANYACDCHNCRARAAVAKATGSAA